MANNFFSTAVGNLGQVSAVDQNQGHLVSTFSMTFSAYTFGSGDVVYLAQIPLLSYVTDFYVSISATLGSTAAFNWGTTTTAAQFASASTTGQGAAANLYSNALNGFVAASLPAQFNTQTTATLPFIFAKSFDVADFLIMTATAAGGAATSATIKGYLRYTVGPQY